MRVVVAVLPFEVHSEKPLAYLESSLAELLSTRLEASGRVDVVEAVTVRETLIAWPGEKTEDVVRRLARELRADWVVVGSLTELAGHYSLDVRVTPVESEITTRTMVLAAQGDDELLDRVNELAAQILAIVEPRPAGGARGAHRRGRRPRRGRRARRAEHPGRRSLRRGPRARRSRRRRGASRRPGAWRSRPRVRPKGSC